MKKKSTTPRAKGSKASNKVSNKASNKKVFDSLRKLIDSAPDEPFEEIRPTISTHAYGYGSVSSLASRIVSEHPHIYNIVKEYVALMDRKHRSRNKKTAVKKLK